MPILDEITSTENHDLLGDVLFTVRFMPKTLACSLVFMPWEVMQLVRYFQYPP